MKGAVAVPVLVGIAGQPISAAATPAGGTLAGVYHVATAAACGRWHTVVTDLSTGQPLSAIDDDGDFVIEAGSVQKLAIAVAVLSEVDAGAFTLSDRLTLTADHIAPGSGIYLNQVAYGDQLTVSNILTAMLQVSDNTAVRLLSELLTGEQINEILQRLGFTATRVEPIPGGRRFYLGYTTPRENNDLLYRLITGKLLSPASTAALLRIMTWPSVGYTDGIRRNMSSAERARIGTKHGALDDKRHETGLVFDRNGAPLLVYSYFADQVPDPDNYGATNPVVTAHATLGRTMLDAYDLLSPLGAAIDPRVAALSHSDGGHG